MTIEIRPAAVRSQISQKSNRMDVMALSLNNSYRKVEQFCNADGDLSGAGFEAAREHMGQYRDFSLAAHECIEMTRRADQQVVSALGAFGWMSRVSEQEWLEKQRQAERQVSSLRSRAAEADCNREWLDLATAYYARALRSLAFAWQLDADHAGRMLSKIYSYCEQTNGLYSGDLGMLTDAVHAGAQAFASCGFDAATHMWGKFDSSWKSDKVQAIIDDNLDVLLLKGYGDIDRALLVDPVASTVSNWWEDTTDVVADWWDRNGAVVENVGKVVFGFAGCVGAIAMIASGVGAPAGIAAMIGFTSSFTDLGTGIAGLAIGQNIEWQEAVGGGVASAFGFDEETGVFAVKTVTTVASIYNISKLPQNIGKLADLASSLSRIMAVANEGQPLNAGFEAVDAISGVNKITLVNKVEEVRWAFASDVCDVIGDAGDVFELASEGLDKLMERRRGSGLDYGNASSAAFRYGG